MFLVKPKEEDKTYIRELSTKKADCIWQSVSLLSVYALSPFTGIYDDERIKPCNWDSVYGFQFLGEVEHFHLPA